ncbi:uncharacterized protein LOC130110641 [Lampris incognitus]|uniref:uncharacterized protein LOC130110641 n=1 Tax=Lampris incognitus TaxID=2546036 RepID=UPI0024B5ADAE|nr:uncharacterized protein LOC130110641 [Lampris incognitus]
MCANWGDNEVRELLTLRAEDEISRHITGTVKDGPLLERLAKQLQERGFARDKAQVTSKLKSLRKKFHQVNDHNGKSGTGRLEWPYFDLCYSIWGTGHSANPAARLSNMEESTPAETDPAASPSSADTGDPSGLDTDASSKNGESAPCDRSEYLPSQKRRKLTKGRVVTKEIKDLLLAMDREDEERDRLRVSLYTSMLRMERRRAYEEQLRRDAQEAEREAREADRRERAEQMNVFGNMFRDIQREMQGQTSLLRDLIARMPVPALPQHPLPVPHGATVEERVSENGSVL